MTADYHTHTPLCLHAEGSPTEYAQQAAKIGLDEIGLSDHSPMPEKLDDWRMLLSDLPNYLEMVEAARAAVPQIPVRLAMEVDYFTDGHAWIEDLASRADWDYLIGSVHYIDQDSDRWDIDNPEKTRRYVATPNATAEIWDAYWKTYTHMAKSGLFDLLGHPDLPKKFGNRPEGDLRRFYEPAIQAAADAGVAIEINTAGWHKDAAEQYPARPFLELMYQADIPLSISSDAHHPSEVGRDFEKAIALAKDVGFTHTVRFQNRQRTLAPLP